MLGSLLTALLLLATGYCVLDSISEHAGDRQGASLSATRPGTRFPIQVSCSSGQSARCWGRQAWIQSGPDGFLPSFAASDWARPCLSQAEVVVPIADRSRGLAKCWQFRWRTALAPRAPSAVS